MKQQGFPPELPPHLVLDAQNKIAQSSTAEQPTGGVAATANSSTTAVSSMFPIPTNEDGHQGQDFVDPGATSYEFGMLGQTSMNFDTDELWNEEGYFKYRSDVAD